jgi:hypothetical protein
MLERLERLPAHGADRVIAGADLKGGGASPTDLTDV